MGTSTDAIFCYGFCVRDEEGNEVADRAPDWLEKPDGSEMGFHDFLARLVGREKPGAYDKTKYDSDPDFRKAWDDYWTKLWGLEKEFGITLVAHCKSDYRMWILAAKESYHRAGRGCAVSLGQGVVVKPEWREKLKAFCERAGIKFEEPELLLCSDWG